MINSIRNRTAVLHAALIVIVAISAACSDQSLASSADKNIFKSDYEDAWVENIPESLFEFEVLFVNTPKNTACNELPVVNVAPWQVVGFESPPAGANQLIEEIKAIPGVPDEVVVSFVPTGTTRERLVSNNESWNEARSSSGCMKLGDFGAPEEAH